MVFINIDTDRCTGCRVCEMICSLTHHEKINPLRSRIHIESSWPMEEHIQVCRQCQDAPCVDACPVKALNQNNEGVIEINQQKCTLCEQCAEACPFNAISVGKEGELLICDTCDGAYECVKWCPYDALSKGSEYNG